MTQYLESSPGGSPLVRDGGLNTKKNVDFSGSSSVNLNSTVKANGVIIPIYELLCANQFQQVDTSFAVSETLFLNDNVSGTYKVAAVSAVFGTTSTSGTLQVEVATGTQAVASGTNQLTGTMSLSGTANTTVNGTIIASPTTISAGARVNLIFAGTTTGLANCVITVALQRLS